MRSLRPVLLAILTAAFVIAPTLAQQGERQAEGAGELKDFATLTQGATAHTGFFDAYEKGDKLWLAVKPAQLGVDFLMEAKVAQGIGAGGLFGGTMLNSAEGKVMAIERHGDRVFLVQRPHRFRAKDDAHVARAVEITFSSSVVESAPIESIRADGAVVFSAYNWFVGDVSEVSTRVRRAAGGNASFDRPRSYIESVKSFPENTNIRTKLTFRPSDTPSVTSVPDNRSFSISVFHTLAALPARPMTTRLADDRVGNFNSTHKDFSDVDSDYFVRYVRRWRLEPGERVGALVRPITPITFYIESSVPEAYRQVFKDGVEAWNDAFEAAGWSGAIRALDLPPDIDPEDIRYATLRWNTSDATGYGAIGPSVADPRTGEILDADILFESNLFRGQKRTWRTLAGPVMTASEAFEQALGVGTFDPALAPADIELAGFTTALVDQGSIAGLALLAQDRIGPGTPVPDDFVMQAAKWVVMHEVGHTLGLAHNFRSSASTPFDRLHDTSFTGPNGVFSSVMEYPNVNVAPGGKTQGHYYNIGVGSYDRWVITYGYTPDDARAAEVARQAADPRHLYGTNAESGGAGALDPSISTYDLSADPLSWGAERAALARSLWNRLPDLVLEDNESYFTVTTAFQGLLREYARGVAPATKYLGGQYLNRDHIGDPGGRLPFQNVPVADQRRALRLIVENLFEESAFQMPAGLLPHLGSNRWLHWGASNTFGERLDFPFHEEIVDLQSSSIRQLLNANRLARIRDAETKYGAAEVVSIPELMDTMTRAIWAELDQAGTISAIRRDLQRAHLATLVTIVTDPPDGMPNDARAVARMELERIGQRLAIRLERGSGLDGYTRAHLGDVGARIKTAITP
ncbi:MAG TPA: zinc-dependent metalloprotease [Vicinamibacterales bacterium]|nr:zinc-dependent metalloprotease [Vicinamibacterales bacterium]